MAAPKTTAEVKAKAMSAKVDAVKSWVSGKTTTASREKVFTDQSRFLKKGHR